MGVLFGEQLGRLSVQDKKLKWVHSPLILCEQVNDFVAKWSYLLEVDYRLGILM